MLGASSEAGLKIKVFRAPVKGLSLQILLLIVAEHRPLKLGRASLVLRVEGHRIGGNRSSTAMARPGLWGAAG
jgi:hypothetical protein